MSSTVAATRQHLNSIILFAKRLPCAVLLSEPFAVPLTLLWQAVPPLRCSSAPKKVRYSLKQRLTSRRQVLVMLHGAIDGLVHNDASSFVP